MKDALIIGAFVCALVLFAVAMGEYFNSDFHKNILHVFDLTPQHRP